MTAVRQTTKDRLEAVGIGTTRVSERGVTHLVYGRYSVAWFESSQKYRVFWPYPSRDGGPQHRMDFDRPEGVYIFITTDDRVEHARGGSKNGGT